MMSREEFVIDAGLVSSGMQELAQRLRSVISGEHAMYLQAELAALAAKLKLAQILVEKQMLIEQLAPIHQEPIWVDLSPRKRAGR